MPLITIPGRYAVTVKTCTIGEAKTGTAFVELAFATDDGETITGWLYLSEKAFDRTVNVLREVFEFDDNFDTIVGQVEGKRCSITVEEEADDKGKMRLRVKWINPERSAAKPVAGNLLASLSAKASRVSRPTPAAKAPAPAVAPSRPPF